MTQFFQVLKLIALCLFLFSCFMMTQFFQVLKLNSYIPKQKIMFYDDSILSGTKTKMIDIATLNGFYDHSILSGTKTPIT